MKLLNTLSIAALVGLALQPGTARAAQGSGDSLGVFDAVRIVLAKNPAILQVEEQVNAADARVKQTESAWFPTVDAEVGYTYLTPIAALSFFGDEFRLYPANNYDAHVSLRQQVYDFGKTSASTNLGRSRVQAARLGVNATRDLLAYQTIHIFDNLLYLRSAITVQDNQIATLREHIAVTKKRVLAGSATEFDVLTTEVRVAAVQNQRIDLVNAENKAGAGLARLMGESGKTDIKPSGSFAFTPVVRNEDSLVALAYQQRPDILTALNDEESARLQMQVVNAADLPSVNVGVNYGLKNGYMPNLDVLRGNVAASVRFRIPITEGGRTGHQEEEAEATLRAARARTTDLKQQIALEVSQSLSDLNSATEKVGTSELQVRQAREALEIARKRYDAGAITNLDLLDAETSLQQAELLRLQVLYAFTTSRFGLDRSIGAEPWR
jgi:outer membrane protein